MKRIGVALFTLVALAVSSVPSYADVVTTGTPGKPLYAQSNTGSPSALMHRSSTGSSMKMTHDGRVYIWDI